MKRIYVKSVEQDEQKIWDKLVTHPLQSWAWGDFRKAMGIKVERLGVYKNDELCECWQISFHPVPHTQFTIGYFPKGPAVSEFMTQELKRLGKKHLAVFIQIEPNISVTVDTQPIHIPSLVSSHHPLFTQYTFSLDLTSTEEDLFKNLHTKTRYNIRIAQKHGVTIQEDNSPEAFKAYLALSEETTKRQGFYAHNKQYQQTMWETLSKKNIAHLWTATYKKEILAAWILFYWKQSIYYPYGSSSRSHREVMAPNLLLWNIALYGKSHGFTTFDLWGAIGPNPDVNDPWYGFHRFKQGYNPQLITYIGSYDLIIEKIPYTLYTIIDKARWYILKLSKK